MNQVMQRLEDVVRETHDIKRLMDTFQDLDRPELFPAKPEHKGAWRKAYEAHKLYRESMGRVTQCFEAELQILEPILLSPSEEDHREEINRASLCLQVAQELGLPRMIYRFRALLEEVRSNEYLEPKLETQRLYLEDLHHHFKKLIDGVFASYKLGKSHAHPLVEEARSLKKQYESVGCSIWGSYCGNLITILERKKNG